MRLTRGEKLALLCLLPIVIGFLPPVTGWVAAVEARVLSPQVRWDHEHKRPT